MKCIISLKYLQQCSPMLHCEPSRSLALCTAHAFSVPEDAARNTLAARLRCQTIVCSSCRVLHFIQTVFLLQEHNSFNYGI